MAGEGNRCIICDQWRERGFFLYDSFICLHCEQEMVETSVEDEKYHYFIKKLKKVGSKKILSSFQKS